MTPDAFHSCLAPGCVAIVAPDRPYCEVHRRRQTKFMRQIAREFTATRHVTRCPRCAESLIRHDELLAACWTLIDELGAANCSGLPHGVHRRYHRQLLRMAQDLDGLGPYIPRCVDYVEGDFEQAIDGEPITVLDGHGHVAASFGTLAEAKAYCVARPDRDDLFIPIAAKDARLVEDEDLSR